MIKLKPPLKRIFPLSIGSFLLLCVFTSTCLGATGRIDLHALWDDRCADCHGHSADFARRFLRIADGRLLGRHHVDNLQLFISQHYTTATQAPAIYAMLQAQTATPPLYQQYCSRCHGSAASLVRSTTILRDGVLLSRRSGQPLHPFLSSHRNLNPQDIDFYHRLLTRIAVETGQR
ncbi:hypothetical protein N8198_07770 [Gammaproteobacteria bacterium]|nr:hypothetical protein [Gammaproteobacteria bacterium]